MRKDIHMLINDEAGLAFVVVDYHYAGVSLRPFGFPLLCA